jgi:hypothetical protein
MIVRPVVRLVMLLYLVGLVGLAGLAACGPNARVQALRGSLVGLNVARDTLLAVSKEREVQIVAEATSKDEGRAQLDAWRAKVDVVASAIEVAYRAVHDAALLSDVKSASEAAAAAKKALSLLKDLRDLKHPVPLPAPSSPPSPPPSPPATHKETKP